MKMNGKFNIMGVKECYSYLQEKQNELEQEFYEKNGFHYDMSYAFLYPEMMKPFISE